MSKKSSLLFGVAAGAAAYFVTKKVLKNQPAVEKKVQELKANGTQVGLRYYDYAKDYFENVDVKSTVADLKQRVAGTAKSLKNNDKLNQAFTSLKTATDELKQELQAHHAAIEQANDDEVDDDDIVIDGRSAFEEAKAAADFEEDHPTETFFPHGEQ
jgi:gas vesicle protein